MFFLFGWGGGKKQSFGPAVPVSCPNCHNQTFLNLVQIKKQFTIFFIPVGSYETINVLSCQICSRGMEISPAIFEKAKRLSEVTSVFLKNEMSKEAYEKSLADADLFEAINKENDNPNLQNVCPNCGKGYDASWKVCMKCSTPLKQKNASLCSR